MGLNHLIELFWTGQYVRFLTVSMCGRSRQSLSARALHAAAVQAGMPQDRMWKDQARYSPQENICPGREVAILAGALHGEDGPQLALMRWGLVTSVGVGSKPDHWRMFNARSETLDSLRVFSRLLASQRCAVPIDGFYEWQTDKLDKQKQPFYVHTRVGAPMWIAGLFTECTDSEGAPLRSFTLITKAADANLAWLHDRMPVIMDYAGLRAWLDHSNSQPLETLRSFVVSSSDLDWHPVSKKM